MESARFKIKESGICTNACNSILSSIFLFFRYITGFKAVAFFIKSYRCNLSLFFLYAYNAPLFVFPYLNLQVWREKAIQENPVRIIQRQIVLVTPSFFFLHRK